MAFNFWRAGLKRVSTAFAPTPQAPDDIVTVATFSPLLRPHAHFLQAQIEAEGIVCILNGQYNTNADFARLQVRREDASRAAEIIHAFDR